MRIKVTANIDENNCEKCMYQRGKIQPFCSLFQVYLGRRDKVLIPCSFCIDSRKDVK